MLIRREPDAQRLRRAVEIEVRQFAGPVVVTDDLRVRGQRRELIHVAREARILARSGLVERAVVWPVVEQRAAQRQVGASEAPITRIPALILLLPVACVTAIPAFDAQDAVVDRKRAV